MWEVEDKTGTMNDVIAGHVSPCVQIFIESLLGDEVQVARIRLVWENQRQAAAKLEDKP
jgi:hypothetical protein